MAQHYSNPTRANDSWSLPNIETFQARYGDCPFCTSTVIEDGSGQFHCDECSGGRKAQGVVPEDVKTGWFYWFCLPGYMPDSEPSGPFATEEEALEDARETAGEDDDDDEDEDEDEDDDEDEDEDGGALADAQEEDE